MVTRDGVSNAVDVTDLVPGDVVTLRSATSCLQTFGSSSTVGLACDESVLTGESLPVDKTIAALAGAPALADLHNCALMGTIVNAGSARGVVVATGVDTEFGKIAVASRPVSSTPASRWDCASSRCCSSLSRAR